MTLYDDKRRDCAITLWLLNALHTSLNSVPRDKR
jgi:hypothetical protein